MAAQAKKAASLALTQLTHYLGRDREASQKMRIVNRYVGELRQGQSALKSEGEVLQKQATAAAARADAAEGVVSALKAQLRQVEVLRQQAETATTQAVAEVAELQKQLEVEDYDDADLIISPGHPLYDMPKYLALCKELRKRMPRPPPVSMMLGEGEDEYVHMCELTDVLTEYSGEQYTRLGMLVTVCCMLGLPMGFRIDPDDRVQLWDGIDSKALTKCAHWGRSLVEPYRRPNISHLPKTPRESRPGKPPSRW